MKRTITTLVAFLLAAAAALVTATFSYGAAPAGCENEPSLAARTDILKCEAWESSTWWQLPGWYRDQGDTGLALDGRRFHRFPVDQTWMDQFSNVQLTTTDCLIGSCLKVNMRGWQNGGGSHMAQNWIIPGIGGCSHDTLGCVPQQEIYFRFYMKLAPNFDPENYYVGNGEAQGGGGKFPGLSDALNGTSLNPAAIQCGNGGEGPETGTECWSLRTNFNVPWHTDNGPRNSCLESKVYNCTTRFGLYPYLYVPFQVEGSRYTSAFADDFYSPPITWSDNQIPPQVFQDGTCTNTYGFHCGLGKPGLVNDKWYMVEMRVKMNTPGTPDGIIQLWLDGTLRYSKTNTMFRLPGHNNVGIRAAWWDIFSGGLSVAMKEDTYALFDQMVVSTAPIGPNTAARQGNMVAVTADPSGGMNGFSRGHYYTDAQHKNGCYMSFFGADSVNTGDNSIRCSRLDLTVGGVPGVWRTPFANVMSNNIASIGKRDNFLSLFLRWKQALIFAGGSYIEPPQNKTISGYGLFTNCDSTMAVNCFQWRQLSRWTSLEPVQKAADFNAAFIGGAGAECPFGACQNLIKNPRMDAWYTDNGAACNDNLHACLHGWGFSNNGEHFILEDNISNSWFCNTGAASGAQPLISCQLPSNPKNIPFFNDNNNTSDQPTGAGTTPGIRVQAMNVITEGPDPERCFYVVGATVVHSGVAKVRDLWVLNCVTKAWTQLAAPPGPMSHTPLMVYDKTRNQLLLQNNNKIYAYPLFGRNVWEDVTPAGGIIKNTINSYGAYIANARLFTIQDGNEVSFNGTDWADNGSPAAGLRAFSMGSSAVLATSTIGFAASVSSGTESATSVLIPVVLTNPPTGTVQVNYAVTGGTATGSGTDYTLTSGTLTFNPGTVTQNIPMTVVNDASVESNETVIVTLSSPVNATLGTATHTYTIVDNDSAPPASVTRFGAGAKIGSGARIGR